jgi:hypothetical protein
VTSIKLPDWKIGDTVYSLRLDPSTGRYRVHGEGRVVRIEGGTLHLDSTQGPRTWPATAWPAFRTREEGEAYIAEHPGPNHGKEPMAHHTAPVAATSAPEPEWQCLRCERVRDGRMVDDDLDHTRRCPYRGTGRDPDVKG